MFLLTFNLIIINNKMDITNNTNNVNNKDKDYLHFFKKHRENKEVSKEANKNYGPSNTYSQTNLNHYKEHSNNNLHFEGRQLFAEVLVENAIDPLDMLNYNLDKFIHEAKTNINKSKYRKVLEEMKDKESKFSICPDKWQIHEIKLKCMCKIINRKYIKSSFPKNIDSWLLRIDLVLENWFEDIKLLESQNKNSILIKIQLEIFIYYLLEQCYNYANFSKYEKQISDTIGFLALGERLIKFIIDSTNYPDTLNVIQRIYLFTSAILIADLDYETAKKYQANALKCGLRELYLRVDDEEGISIDKLNKSEQHYVRKCVTNIVLGFYQRGVCEENLGCILKAIESYKQAKWFSLNFLKNHSPELTMFIEDVETRAINYNKLINTIKNINNDADVLTKKEKTIKETLFFNEEQLLKKYDHLKTKIDKMNFQEIEESNILKKKSEKVKFILSTVKLVNNLTSEKFRDLMTNAKDLKVNYMNREFKDKLQRRLNEVKAEELFNEKINIKDKREVRNNISSKSVNKEITSKNTTKDKVEIDNKEEDNNFSSNKEIVLVNEDFVNHCDKLLRLEEDENESKKITRPETSKEYLNNKALNSLSNNHTKHIPNKLSYDKQPEEVIKETSKANYDEILHNSTSIEKNIISKHKTTRASDNNDRQEDSYILNNKSIQTINKNKTTNKNNSKSKQRPHSSIKQGYSPSTLHDIELNKIIKYDFSSYIGNNKYNARINYLETVENKEMRFQKDLLKVKKQEKLVIDKFDLKKVDENCEQFFNKILVNTKKTFIDDQKAHKKKEILLEEKNKYEVKKAELTNKVLRSLDVNKLEELSKFVKANEKPMLKIRENFKTIQDSNKEIDNCTANKINKERENLINLQISGFETTENLIKRDIWPNTYKSKNKKQVTKSLKSLKDDGKFNVNLFIKRKNSLTTTTISNNE